MIDREFQQKLQEIEQDPVKKNPNICIYNSIDIILILYLFRCAGPSKKISSSWSINRAMRLKFKEQLSRIFKFYFKKLREERRSFKCCKILLMIPDLRKKYPNQKPTSLLNDKSLKNPSLLPTFLPSIFLLTKSCRNQILAKVMEIRILF